MKPNLAHERQIPLKNVRLLIPEDRRPCYHTIRYWTKWGIRGIKLESRRMGGRIFTSAEALERFQKLTNGEPR